MKKLTAEWLRKAEADLRAAKLLVRAKPPVTDPACFECQQAAEKFLKALMEENGLTIPKIHDLDDLLDLLLPHESSLAKLSRAVNTLTEYAVDYRYPGIHASARQARAAVRWAERVRLEIRRCLGLPDRKRRPRKEK